MCYLLHWKSFKDDEKCFLSHLKSSFCSQDIKVFVTTFWLCRKSGLIRKIRLTSKFMTSQPGLQTIAIHIWPKISQSKGNQTMKSGQSIEYKKKNISFQILCGKWDRESSPRLLFVFWKKLDMRWKQVTSTCPYNKGKLYKTLDYWSRDMLLFNISEQGLGLVCPPHFVNGFSRKTFLILRSIKWPNFIVWLPSILEILGNMCNTIVC